jgi:hypothetical protein
MSFGSVQGAKQRWWWVGPVAHDGWCRPPRSPLTSPLDRTCPLAVRRRAISARPYQPQEEDAEVIDLLGMVVFGTIVGIGLLDGRRGLSVFASYPSAGVTGRRRVPKTKRDGGENQPKPPTPAR